MSYTKIMEHFVTANGDGTPRAEDFIFAVYFAVVFVVARVLLDKFVFPRLAIWLFTKGGVPPKFNKATQAKLVKCSESLWKLAYYTTAEVCILCILYHEPWFRDTKAHYRGWPNHELKVPLKLVYLCQCGFYLYSIGALVTWETPRKDFSVMMAHHVITVALITYSYISSFFRGGSIVLALHDASDVFMEAGKICKYAEREVAASVLFGVFAISWLLLRLILFPLCVILPYSDFMMNSWDLSQPWPRFIFYVTNIMLLTLLACHLYWWTLICSMIRRQLRNKGKLGQDIRSDSEDED